MAIRSEKNSNIRILQGFHYSLVISYRKKHFWDRKIPLSSFRKIPTTYWRVLLYTLKRWVCASERAPSL